MLAGRQADLRELLGAAEAARRGRGGLVLIGGEPGIGKTRLAAEVSDRLGVEGFRTAWVSCREDPGAPPYWPWSRLLGELGHALAAAVDRVSREPDRELARFALFEAVIDTLRGLARDSPVLLVLDDAHWLDEPSLRLLAALTPELANSALVVLATYRDTEPGSDRLLAALPPGRRLALGGLSRDELVAALRDTTGERLGDALGDALHRRTAGNPYFAAEIVRLLRADGRLASPSDGPIPLPDSVRAVLERRLARLPAPVHALLHVLALLGEPVRLPLAARVAELATSEAMEFAQAAVSARLLTAGAVEFHFAHPLVRQTLVAQLGPAARLALHQRIGAVLADRVDAGIEPPTEAAGQLLAAAALGGSVSEAVRRARAAAEWAVQHTAYEDAVRLLESALGLLGAERPERGELLGALGEAALAAGDRVRARAAYLAAVADARQHARPELLATAALGLAGGVDGFEIDLLDPDRVEVLSQALHALPDRDSGVRALLLSRLSLALSFTSTESWRRELSEAAVRMARRQAEPSVLGSALAAHCDVVSGPDHVRDRRAAATEIIRLAAESGDRPRELLGRRLRLMALAEAGEWTAVDTEIELYARLADRVGQARFRWYVPLWRGTRALMRGELDEADSYAEEHAGLVATAGSPNAELLGWVQRFVRLVGEGRIEDIQADFLRFLSLSPNEPSVAACSLAFLDALAGRLDQARTQLDGVVAGPDMPRDSEWLPSVAQVAVASVLAGHHAAAELAYRLLRPYPGLFVVEGILAGSWGSVDAHLGRLAGFLGRPERAAEHFTAALTLDAVAGAALAGRTRGWAEEWCPAEAAPPRPGHPVRRESAWAAPPRPGQPVQVQTPAAIHQTAPSARCRTGPFTPTRAAGPAPAGAAMPARPGVVVPPRPPDDAPERARFRRDGTVWTMEYAGRTARLPDMKGLRDLAVLLRRPGQRTHVSELLGAVVVAGDLGPLADRRAIAAYRARLAELADELSAAEDAADLARAERLRLEREALLGELSSVAGLAGRPREHPAENERMRKAVTNRVNQAVKRIGQAHPELGRHLRASIRTGRYCGYEPEYPVRWEL